MACILVVEDEAVVAADLSDMLLGLGHEVSGIAATGRDALELAARRPPDLVLMDVRLRDDMDGVETAHDLRRRMEVPIVFLTAHGDAETVERACEAEPAGYVVKPFREHHLRGAVSVALRRRRVDRELRARLDWLSATLDGMGDAVVATDARGMVTLANEASEAITGWLGGAGVTRHVTEVLSLRSRASELPLEHPALRALHEREVVALREPACLRTRDGRPVLVECTAAPILVGGGRPSGAVVVFRDVSERAREEAHVAAQGRLESVGALTSGIAHEMSSPLSAAISSQTHTLNELSFLRLVLERLPLEEHRQDLLARVTDLQSVVEDGHAAAAHMRSILAALRQFMAPACRRAPVRLEGVIAGAVRLCEEELRGRAELLVRAGEVPEVVGDEEALVQVLVHLLRNAGQAISPARGERGSVTVRAFPRSDAEVVIAVDDTGIGIAPGDLERVFDPFFTTRPGGGMGLGLSIAQRLVDAHGGRIEVESQLGRGTTMRVVLPARTEARERRGP